MKIHGTISTLEDFNKLIDNIRWRRGYTIAHRLPTRQEFYRGQLSANWPIKPGLTRQLKTKEEVILAESRILQKFMDEVKAKDYLHKIYLHDNPRQYQNEWAWLIQAQHYGIPTRMLDWTLKPEVALYFAVENSSMDDEDGQFLFLYYPMNEIKTGAYGSEYEHILPENISETWFLNPPFQADMDFENATGERRRMRQHGKFTIQSYENSLIGMEEQPKLSQAWNETYDAVIEKYIIPADAKAQLRLDILAKGWDGEFLYVFDDPIINEIIKNCKEVLQEIVTARQ